jgi:predicted nucleic acid-binding Zn ribbon protein
MKCATHQADAIAICTYCGRGLCPVCERAPALQRVTCSPACAEALAKGDRAVDLTLRKSIQMAKAGAYGCYVMGVLLIVFAIYSHRVYPEMRVSPLMAAAFGVGMLIFGASYHRAASRK